jgi:ligand-binding sensor domain-containing protein
MIILQRKLYPLNKFFLCCLLLLGSFVHTHAQRTKQFIFTPCNKKTGLVTNTIYDIAQDKNGFIWLATPEGLIRYDGIRYKYFRKRAIDKSIPFSLVSDLHFDHKDRLWLLHSEYQPGYFNTETFVFTPVAFQLRDTTLKAAGKDFLKGTGEHIVLGVGLKELLVFDEKSGAFIQNNDYFPYKPYQNIKHCWTQPYTNIVWAVVNDSVMRYDRDVKTASYTSRTVEEKALMKALAQYKDFQGFYWDRKNRIWFSALNTKNEWRFCCYDFYAQKLREDLLTFYPEHRFRSIWETYEQRNGTLWFRGYDVLGYFDEKEQKISFIESGHKAYQQMNYTQINALLEDRTGNMWTGTEYEGLYFFHASGSMFTNIQLTSKKHQMISDGSPLSFLLDKDSTLLTSVWGEGYYRFDLDFNLLSTNLFHQQTEYTLTAWDMCYDNNGQHAWFACQPGIYRYDMITKRGEYYNPPILEGRTVRQMAMDPLGNLWLGTQNRGLFKWEAAKGSADFEAGLRKPEAVNIKKQINQIRIDSKGMVWVATEINGVYAIDSKTDAIVWHFHENGEGVFKLTEKGISQVLEYSDSIMIITTGTTVLKFNRIKNEIQELFNDEDIFGFIAALEKDKFGNVWMGTTSNLYRFHPYTTVIISFGEEDGLFRSNFALSASYSLPDGRLVFGCDDRFIVFDPSRVKANTALSKITLSDIRVNQKSLQVIPKEAGTKDGYPPPVQLTLGAEASSLVIEFSPLTFNSLQGVQYKLEGLDKDWIWVGTDKNGQANYNYIPPGNYRFLLRSVDTELNYSPIYTAIELRVYPPFYRAWWFYGICAVGVLVLFYWFDRERMRRKEAVINVRNNIADDLHQEVNTAMQQINILSEMAQMKATDDPQKSQEFLTLIHQKSQKTMVTLDDMLWSIAPENDSMPKTIARLKEYVATINTERSHPVDLMVEDDLENLKIDMKMRYEMILLIKEGLNYISSACPQSIKLHLAQKANVLQWIVYYDHADYDKVSLNNFYSRKDLGNRLQTIHGNWEIKHQKTGFVFGMYIPLMNA